MDYYPWVQNQQDPAEVGNQTALVAQAEAQSEGQLIVRSADAKPMDLGSQVGARRNLEFSAGQRSHRISTGSYTKA